MPISLSFSMEELAGNLTADQKAASEEGTLDADEVYFQFLCTTDDDTDEHDPDGEPDDRVRPEHAALHGNIFRIDDPMAPVPPIDWGCRCAMRYVGKEDSDAAEVLGASAKEDEVTTVADSYAEWLDANVTDWEIIAEAIKKLPMTERFGTAKDMAKEMGITDPASVARMVVTAAGAK